MTSEQSHTPPPDEGYIASLGAILSLTTGRLVAPLGDVYMLQDFLVGRPLMTHERIVNTEAQVDALIKQFPQLDKVHAPSLYGTPRHEVEQACRDWVASVAGRIGWNFATVRAVEGLEVDPGEAWHNVAKVMGPGR